MQQAVSPGVRHTSVAQTPRPEADPWGALVSGAATHGRELGHCNSPSNPKCGYCNECRTCDGSCTNCCPELVHALNWASEYPPSPTSRIPIQLSINWAAAWALRLLSPRPLPCGRSARSIITTGPRARLASTVAASALGASPHMSHVTSPPRRINSGRAHVCELPSCSDQLPRLWRVRTCSRADGKLMRRRWSKAAHAARCGRLTRRARLSSARARLAACMCS